MGLPRENIVIWSKNGIEHYYPALIMKSIFNSSDAITLDGDMVKLNELEYNKNDLVDLVLPKMDRQTKLPLELESEFLKKIDQIVT